MTDDSLNSVNDFTFTEQNARFTVVCKECEKPRLIYGKSKFAERHEKMQLDPILSEFAHSCGSPITIPEQV